MSGLERIQALFARAKAGRRAVFMPYHAMGYPDRAQTIAMIQALGAAGAELFEIGIPHSDPLADGPVVQAATYAAIQQGVTVADCLAMTRELRAGGMTQPFCAMSYYNPLFAYGIEKFVADAARSGIDGLIVPDLPPEEADELEIATKRAGLAMIYMLTPTSTKARIKVVAQRATGFIYLVSVVGTTGIRTELPTDLQQLIARVRAETGLPVAVGFGIGNRQQAAAVAKIADGVIVGSAMVKAAQEGIEAVRTLGAELAMGAATQ